MDVGQVCRRDEKLSGNIEMKDSFREFISAFLYFKIRYLNEYECRRRLIRNVNQVTGILSDLIIMSTCKKNEKSCAENLASSINASSVNASSLSLK